MQLMMPLMFGYFTAQFAAGLAIYFLISNIVAIALQWVIERMEGPAIPVIPQEIPADKKVNTSYGRKKQRRKAKR
ncbi:MAG: hypothetical protein A2Y73_05595 [Chloroflexi bacterium RBG_13_56_8]|nr:MAG: hypothetical protein A2Y73_05595 [Chloroflexi bacterium RBG_13_56_8]